MNKKELIFQSALLLFSQEEYAAVSTMKIAQQAGVSDALIFKHFKNKANLFQELITSSENKLYKQINSLINQNDSALFIKEIFEFPFNISKEDLFNWRFILKLKWNKNFNTKYIWTELKEKLERSLSFLQFQDSEKEAGLIILILESIIEQIILSGQPSMLQYKYFLIHKYTL